MKKLLLILALVALCVFPLAACGDNDQPTADNNAADNTAADNEEYKVVIAAQSNSGQIFQYIAEQQGYLEEEGVDVEISYINNGTDAFTALTAGQVDVLSTYGTGGPLIQIANGQDYNIFGGYMIIGETPCYGKPETEWKDLNSFVGKTIDVLCDGYDEEAEMFYGRCYADSPDIDGQVIFSGGAREGELSRVFIEEADDGLLYGYSVEEDQG